MFQLRPAEREIWQILNSNDELVFSGSRRQCEDWLDRQENLTRLQRRPLAELASRVRTALSRLSARPARVVATAEKCEFPPEPKFR